jgi:hypothetical protein
MPSDATKEAVSVEFISHIRHLAFQLGLLAILPGLAWPHNCCDLNQDGTVNAVDLQLANGGTF